MKKITILALHLGYGGVENSICSLANILIDKYDVKIISVYNLYDKPAFMLDDRVKVEYLLDRTYSPNKEEFKNALKRKNILLTIKEGIKSIKILYMKKYRMIQAVKDIKSGIIISTRIEHNEILSKYGKESTLKIAQEHTYHNNNNKYIERLVKSCNNIDYFMPVSQSLTEFYYKYFEQSKTICKYIPHSLDYMPDKVSSLENKNIISIGRLSPEKGFLDLLDVFSLVSKNRKDWKLNIIGDGIERDLIKEKIEILGLEDNVILHGYKDKEYIKDIFMKSSIYAMGSHEESFGLVLIESQSFGVPCIAFSSATGACEIIENGKNGYLIDNRDKEEMAQKIISLIDDINLRKEMGYKSRVNANQYSKYVVKEAWMNFLRNL